LGTAPARLQIGRAGAPRSPAESHEEIALENGLVEGGGRDAGLDRGGRLHSTDAESAEAMAAESVTMALCAAVSA
jgi:hypothetical protein